MSSSDLNGGSSLASMAPIGLGILAIIAGAFGVYSGVSAQRTARNLTETEIPALRGQIDALERKLTTVSSEASQAATSQVMGTLAPQLGTITQAVKDDRATINATIEKINSIETFVKKSGYRSRSTGSGTTVATGDTGATTPSGDGASGKTYTVVKGDTPSKIAAKTGTTATALMAANPGLNPNKMAIGQKINLPAAK